MSESVSSRDGFEDSMFEAKAKAKATGRRTVLPRIIVAAAEVRRRLYSRM